MMQVDYKKREFMYTRILHATDLLDNHYAQCQHAVDIAQRFQATLYLLHVIEQPMSLQVAQGLGFAEVEVPKKEDAWLVMRTLGDDLNIPAAQQFIEVGSIKSQVFQKALALQCQLIIVGQHTPQQIPTFFESTAQELFHEAPCDLLILK